MPLSRYEQQIYWIWAAMIQRCINPRNKGYARYGGRGIAVCPEWRQSFRQFMADMGPRLPRMTLERVDCNEGYSKENCKWATYAEQASNRPGFCRYVEVDGNRVSTKQAWRLLSPKGLTYRRVMTRIERDGWSVAKALIAPPTEKGKRSKHGVITGSQGTAYGLFPSNPSGAWIHLAREVLAGMERDGRAGSNGRNAVGNGP